MKYNLLISNISKHIDLSEEAKQFSLSKFKLIKLEKKQVVLHEGNLCKNIFFINSGFLRAFVVNDEGKESTLMFGDVDYGYELLSKRTARYDEYRSFIKK